MLGFKTGLSLKKFITDRSKAVLLLYFILILCVRFLLVFGDLLILFRIAWWTSAGEELTSWLFACAVLIYAVWIFCSIWV